MSAPQFTKLRPHVHTMIKELEPLYEMRVFTKGTRPYAEQVVKFLQPSVALDEHGTNGTHVDAATAVSAKGADRAGDTSGARGDDRGSDGNPCCNPCSRWGNHSL